MGEVSPQPGSTAFREEKTASAPCGVSETPALKAGMGLQRRYPGRKSPKTTPTHHEHETKWKIPDKSAIMHEPEREIKKLREHLANPETPLLFLFGAGTSYAVNIGTRAGTNQKPQHIPLIPDMAGLTTACEERIKKDHEQFHSAWVSLSSEAASILKAKRQAVSVNVEHILNRLRAKIEAATETDKWLGLTKNELEEFEMAIKKAIARKVRIDDQYLNDTLPHVSFASWLKGAERKYPVEVFTTNYDVLFEYSFERVELQYFDGFVGGFRPFFYADAIDEPKLLPSQRWVRFWKLHGSVGWKLDKINKDKIIRTTDQCGAELIYPSQLKYYQSRKQPYVAMFDRLTSALNQQNTLLITSGYSFGDEHLNAIILNVLMNRPLNNAYCIYYEKLSEGDPLVKLAEHCPRLAVLGSNAAVINGRYGEWDSSVPITDKSASYMDPLFDLDAPMSDDDEPRRGRFRMGDFNRFCGFLRTFDQFTPPE